MDSSRKMGIPILAPNDASNPSVNASSQEEKKFKCTECTTMFTLKCNLNRHVKNFHRNVHAPRLKADSAAAVTHVISGDSCQQSENISDSANTELPHLRNSKSFKQAPKKSVDLPKISSKFNEEPNGIEISSVSAVDIVIAGKDGGTKNDENITESTNTTISAIKESQSFKSTQNKRKVVKFVNLPKTKGERNEIEMNSVSGVDKAVASKGNDANINNKFANKTLHRKRKSHTAKLSPNIEKCAKNVDFPKTSGESKGEQNENNISSFYGVDIEVENCDGVKYDENMKDSDNKTLPFKKKSQNSEPLPNKEKCVASADLTVEIPDPKPNDATISSGDASVPEKKKFKCTECTAVFTLKSNLQRHVKKSHLNIHAPQQMANSAAAVTRVISGGPCQRSENISDSEITELPRKRNRKSPKQTPKKSVDLPKIRCQLNEKPSEIEISRVSAVDIGKDGGTKKDENMTYSANTTLSPKKEIQSSAKRNKMKVVKLVDLPKTDSKSKRERNEIETNSISGVNKAVASKGNGTENDENTNNSENKTFHRKSQSQTTILSPNEEKCAKNVDSPKPNGESNIVRNEDEIRSFSGVDIVLENGDGVKNNENTNNSENKTFPRKSKSQTTKLSPNEEECAKNVDSPKHDGETNVARNENDISSSGVDIVVESGDGAKNDENMKDSDNEMLLLKEKSQNSEPSPNKKKYVASADLTMGIPDSKSNDFEMKSISSGNASGQDKKKFKCTECTSIFTLKSSLQRHVKKFHVNIHAPQRMADSAAPVTHVISSDSRQHDENISDSANTTISPRKGMQSSKSTKNKGKSVKLADLPKTRGESKGEKNEIKMNSISGVDIAVANTENGTENYENMNKSANKTLHRKSKSQTTKLSTRKEKCMENVDFQKTGGESNIVRNDDEISCFSGVDIVLESGYGTKNDANINVSADKTFLRKRKRQNSERSPNKKKGVASADLTMVIPDSDPNDASISSENESGRENKLPRLYKQTSKKDAFSDLTEIPKTDSESNKNLSQIKRSTGNDQSNTERDTYCWVCLEKININKDVESPCTSCPKNFHLACRWNESVSYNRIKISTSAEFQCRACLLKEYCKEPSEKKIDMLRDTFLNALDVIKKMPIKIKNRFPDEIDSIREAYWYPVPLSTFPDYSLFVVYPMDYGTISQNVQMGKYKSIAEFLSDAEWILHNSCLYNVGNQENLKDRKLAALLADIYRIEGEDRWTGGYMRGGKTSTTAIVAKNLYQKLVDEMSTITCLDCHHRNLTATAGQDGKTSVCENPHMLVWSVSEKLPAWPSKVASVDQHDGSLVVIVEYLGSYKFETIPLEDCFLYSLDAPKGTKDYKISKKSFALRAKALQDAKQYIKNLENRFGDSFHYAPNNTQFDPFKILQQWRQMIPSFPESCLDKTQLQHKFDASLSACESNSEMTAGSHSLNLKSPGGDNSYCTLDHMDGHSSLPEISYPDGVKWENGVIGSLVSRDSVVDAAQNEDLSGVGNDNERKGAKRNSVKGYSDGRNGNEKKAGKGSIVEGKINVKNGDEGKGGKRSSVEAYSDGRSNDNTNTVNDSQNYVALSDASPDDDALPMKDAEIVNNELQNKLASSEDDERKLRMLLEKSEQKLQAKDDELKKCTEQLGIKKESIKRNEKMLKKNLKEKAAAIVKQLEHLRDESGKKIHQLMAEIADHKSIKNCLLRKLEELEAKEKKMGSEFDVKCDQLKQCNEVLAKASEEYKESVAAIDRKNEQIKKLERLKESDVLEVSMLNSKIEGIDADNKQSERKIAKLVAESKRFEENERECVENEKARHTEDLKRENAQIDDLSRRLTEELEKNETFAKDKAERKQLTNEMREKCVKIERLTNENRNKVCEFAELENDYHNQVAHLDHVRKCMQNDRKWEKVQIEFGSARWYRIQVEETKRKTWCVNCQKEAKYRCCDTNYCSALCRRKHATTVDLKRGMIH